MRRGAAIAALCASAAAADPLQDALQEFLDKLTAKNPYAIQLGWKSADREFTLASGKYTLPTGDRRPHVTTTRDTFCFGSGIKPFTAAAVVNLAEQGKLKLDDPLEKHVDPVLRSMGGTTLQQLFGADAGGVTVRHVLQMRSGIADYDWPDFDNGVLLNHSYERHNPIEFINYAASQKPKMVCKPGSCVCYSSTNFILAGMVLLAHSAGGPTADWTTLDQTATLPSAVVKDDMKSCHFINDVTMDTQQTVPGLAGGGWSHAPVTSIYNQSATILGWTCGNLVATALDVARFYWDLVGPAPRAVSPASLKEMEQFKPLSTGWAKGTINYGTGLMIQATSPSAAMPPAAGDWGNYVGHGGDSFGFLSEQGVYYHLNASMSIIANQDGDGAFVKETVSCGAVQIAARVLLGETVDLKCSQ